MIDKSEKEIILVQPYYYRISKFEKAIKKALERGVSVKVVTSQKRDQMCYKNINNEFIFKDLISKGMQVYEYRHQYLHMKAYLSDGKVNVGSMNNDRWSWYVNNELNILINNPVLYLNFKHYIQDTLIPACYPVTNPNHFTFFKKIQFNFWHYVMKISEKFIKKVNQISVHQS